MGQTSHDNIRAYTLAQFLTRSGRYDGAAQRYILTGKPAEAAGRTVIVDECSMLTEEMLAALIEALTGIDRLILVGDRRQLPPIGAGKPFIDIIMWLKPEEFTQGSPKVGHSYAGLYPDGKIPTASNSQSGSGASQGLAMTASSRYCQGTGRVKP